MTRYTIAMCSLLSLPACTDPFTDPDQPASPAGERGRTALEEGLDTADLAGNLRVYLTDAPAAYDEVWVTISRVEISRDEIWTTLVDEPQTVDLLTLRDDVTAVLGDAALTPAAYGQLRLIVDSASLVIDGVVEPLTIPSAAQTGIKLNLDLTVEPDTDYALVLDFDAEASVHRTGNGGWKMQPVIAIEYLGTIAEDGGVTPTDGEGDGGGPDAGFDVE